jgi:hypothetical protein
MYDRINRSFSWVVGQERVPYARLTEEGDGDDSGRHVASEEKQYLITLRSVYEKKRL